MILQLKETEHGTMISSRELHNFLDVGRVFASWIRGRIEKYHFEKNVDYKEIWVNNKYSDTIEMPNDSDSLANKGYEKDYYVTINMAKELCVLENSEKGRKARRYLIACEENYINMIEAKLYLCDDEKIAVTKNSELKKVIKLSNEFQPILYKFKKSLEELLDYSNKIGMNI